MLMGLNRFITNSFFKKINMICLIITLNFLLLSCELSKKNNIIGVWEGQQSELILQFNFNQDLTCKLTIKNIALNTRNTLNGEYKIDYSKKPIPLSITNIPQLSYSLNTIIEFLDSDSVKFGIFAPHLRFREVSFQRNKSFILKKIQSNQALNEVNQIGKKIRS